MKKMGKRSVRLSKRLLTTVGLVKDACRVADVGCDHAYTSIYLLQNALAEYVLALDVKEGPLAIARENVKRFGCGDGVCVRRSDGLSAVTPGEVDAVLISGLGGRLMVRILTEGEDVVRKAKELVLQPQSEIPMVRRYLHERGYRLARDAVVKDEGKYYVAIRAVAGVERYDKEEFYEYGKIPLEGKDETLREYLGREWTLNQKLLRELQGTAARSKQAAVRLQEVEAALEMVQKALDIFG